MFILSKKGHKAAILKKSLAMNITEMYVEFFGQQTGIVQLYKSMFSIQYPCIGQ